MEKFFQKLLIDLDKLTGIKQYKKLEEDREKGKAEADRLVQLLCRACQQYPDVPPDAQKRAIRDAVILDDDFIGLNVRFVCRALNRARERMAQNTPKTEVIDNPNIVTGEARDEWLRKWREALDAAVDAMGVPGETSEEAKERARKQRIAMMRARFGVSE